MTTIRMQMHGCDVEMAILSLWAFKSELRIRALSSRFGTPINSLTAELRRRTINAPPRMGMS
jgi:hypothetical protein